MAGFPYPGCTRWQAKLRRWLIGSVAAAAFLSLLIVLRRLFGSALIESVLAALPVGKWLPVLQGFSFLGAMVTVGWAISGLSPIRAIEFHLFPWFDTVTLRPIRRNTGLLVWSELIDSPVHAGQRHLREWLRQDIHDGRWPLGWIINGEPKLKGKAFRYALVLGPNGIGKTQMVRELARDLAGRHRPRQGWPGRKRRLAAWLRRVIPFCRRAGDDPWDAGRINFMDGGWKDNLQDWRPAAPTLLILDDPVGDMAKEIVDCLAKNSNQFWHSVRLIIIDQFIPLHLPLEQDGGRWHDRERDWPVEGVKLGEVHWSGLQFRSAVARGLWTVGTEPKEAVINLATDVKAFWQESPLDRLCTVLDGNPLMLAEAAHWLARKPRRPLTALLQSPSLESIETEAFSPEQWRDYRAKVTHQLLRDRVEELFRSHRAWEKANEIPDLTLVKAIACAALAGEVPLSSVPDLDTKVGRSELALVVPHGQQGMLPAPGSWPIAEAYVDYLLAEFPAAISLDRLVEQAFRANPAGVARRLARSGRLVERIAAIIHDHEGTDDPALRRDLFLAAASRAMWAGREVTPQALAFLETVPDPLLPETLERLIQLGETQDRRIPDGVVALLLLMALAARRFAAGLDMATPQGQRFFDVWNRWLRRPGTDLRWVPTPLLDPLKRSYRMLSQTVITGLERLNDPEEGFARWQRFLRFGDIRRPLCEEWEQEWAQGGDGWNAVFRALFHLKSLCCHDEDSLPDRETISAAAEAAARRVIALVPDLATPAQRAAIECSVRAWLIYLQTEFRAERATIEAAVREVEAIAARITETGPIGEWVQVHASFAWSKLAQSYVGEIDHAADKAPELRQELAPQVAALAERTLALSRRFPTAHSLQENLAWGWVFALDAIGLGDPAPLQTACSALEELGRSFLNDVAIQTVIASGWQRLAGTYTGRPEEEPKVPEALARLDALGERFLDIGNIQWSRINGWTQWCSLLVDQPKRRLEIESIVRRIDRWAVPFPDHWGIQAGRTWAWSLVTEARQKEKVDEGRVDEAACRTSWIGARFQDRPFARIHMVSAWSSAAEAMKDVPGRRHRVEEYARRIDTLASVATAAGHDPFLESIETLRALTWTWVSNAMTDSPAYLSRLEQIRGAIDAIATRYPTNDDIRKYRAWAHYYYVKAGTHAAPATACSPEDRERLLGAIAQTRCLALPFADRLDGLIKNLDQMVATLEKAAQKSSPVVS